MGDRVVTGTGCCRSESASSSSALVVAAKFAVEVKACRLRGYRYYVRVGVCRTTLLSAMCIRLQVRRQNNRKGDKATSVSHGRKRGAGPFWKTRFSILQEAWKMSVVSHTVPDSIFAHPNSFCLSSWVETVGHLTKKLSPIMILPLAVVGMGKSLVVWGRTARLNTAWRAAPLYAP